MAGKGAAKAKMATKETAAMVIVTAFFSARLPMRTTACSTMASTAALRPKNRAATKPRLP